MKRIIFYLFSFLCTIPMLAQSDYALRQKLKGSWYYGNNFAYCEIYIDDSTVCWVDKDPEHWYKYTLSHDTLHIEAPSDELEWKDARIQFKGDSLILRVLNSGDSLPQVYYPFDGIIIHGTKLKFPQGSGAEAETQFDKIIDALAKEPVNQLNIRKWRDVLYGADGAVAEYAEDCLSALYMRHPQPFLTWIYNRREEENDPIRQAIFGGLEEIVGMPDKNRVKADILKYKESKGRAWLLNQFSKWGQE